MEEAGSNVIPLSYKMQIGFQKSKIPNLAKAI